MKTKRIITAIMAVAMMLVITSCTAAFNSDEVWSNATYKEDTSFGNGSKTVVLDVIVGDNSVRLTVKTDSATVGDALLENGLIAGDNGAYGLYIKTVNGITADFDIDQSYWSFNVNGAMSMTGADTTEISEGVIYSFVYTK